MDKQKAEAAVREQSAVWLTGFYEGEGNPLWNRYFGLRTAQKERAVLDWIVSVFGGSVRDNGRGVFHWTLSHERAVKLAYEMLGYMHSPVKVEQLRRALILTGRLVPRTTVEAGEVVVHAELMRCRRAEDAVKRREYMKGYYLRERREQEVQTRKWLREHPEVASSVVLKEVS